MPAGESASPYPSVLGASTCAARCTANRRSISTSLCRWSSGSPGGMGLPPEKSQPRSPVNRSSFRADPMWMPYSSPAWYLLTELSRDEGTDVATRRGVPGYGRASRVISSRQTSAIFQKFISGWVVLNTRSPAMTGRSPQRRPPGRRRMRPGLRAVDDFRPVPEGPGPPMAEDQRDGIGPGARLAHEVNARAGHINQVVLVGIHRPLGSPVVLLGPVPRQLLEQGPGRRTARPRSLHLPARSWPAAATADPREPAPQRRSAPASVHSRRAHFPLLTSGFRRARWRAEQSGRVRPRCSAAACGQPREPANETAQPLRASGMAPGHDRLSICGERQHRGRPSRGSGLRSISPSRSSFATADVSAGCLIYFDLTRRDLQDRARRRVRSGRIHSDAAQRRGRGCMVGAVDERSGEPGPR